MKKMIEKLINIAQFTHDCGCKMDFNFPILECSSRIYDCDEPSAYVHICIPKRLDSDNSIGNYTIDSIDILNDELFADNIDELKVKIRNWYKENYIKALQMILKEDLSE